jgi:hypothetical protein
MINTTTLIDFDIATKAIYNIQSIVDCMKKRIIFDRL